MRYQILDSIPGRMRIHIVSQAMTCDQADVMQYTLEQIPGVAKVKVHERTANAIITYPREDADCVLRIRETIASFSYRKADVPEDLCKNSGRQMSHDYQDRLFGMIAWHYARRYLLPFPVRMAYNGIKALHYVIEGLKVLRKGKLEVPVLDGTAVAVSMLHGDVDTAGSVMFLLEIGELLQEWTHKKSVGDLARIMSLNVDKVWLRKGGQEVSVPFHEVRVGDQVVVHMGNVIPFDGKVTEGEAMVNQASLTGEALPVRRTCGGVVYGGTVVEEGSIVISVTQTGGCGRYDKIVTMIEESEKLKSGLESQAEHLADKLVPYTFLGTGLAWLLTRDIHKTLSVLMVDFSCALKLAMPITVLSAIRESGEHNITVKGGRCLEALAQADTIVFDKTGTLTKAEPTVSDVLSFNGKEKDELLRIAACLEEHFPHSMAKAVVEAARAKGLSHEEMHSEVEYIVAHGIATTIDGARAIIGSYHFVFEDEKTAIREDQKEAFGHLPADCSHLYMAIDGILEAVICVRDPLREESVRVVGQLKKAGFSRIVMMTGDSERTARSIAGQLGLDAYYAEVLPEDKARYVETQKKAGHHVVMVGDGINDSPALSSADVGIAIGEGAQIAREVADVTISADSLEELVVLKTLSDKMVHRIRTNYRTIVGFNSGLIVLGVAGIIQPTVSALFHNLSTILIALRSMRNLLPAQEGEQ